MVELYEVTPEYLGPDATEADVVAFKRLVGQLLDRPETRFDYETTEDAMAAVYGDGDYLKNARNLGLLVEPIRPAKRARVTFSKPYGYTVEVVDVEMVKEADQSRQEILRARGLDGGIYTLTGANVDRYEIIEA